MMLRHLPPHPVPTLLLTLVWPLRVNRFNPGNTILGIAPDIAIPVVTQPSWQQRPVPKRPSGS